METIASASAGLIGGAHVGLFLVSNPVGWGAAFVLAAGTAAASYGAGYYTKELYTLRGEEVDFVSGLGVDSICR